MGKMAHILEISAKVRDSCSLDFRLYKTRFQIALGHQTALYSKPVELALQCNVQNTTTTHKNILHVQAMSTPDGASAHAQRG